MSTFDNSWAFFSSAFFVTIFALFPYHSLSFYDGPSSCPRLKGHGVVHNQVVSYLKTVISEIEIEEKTYQ